MHNDSAYILLPGHAVIVMIGTHRSRKGSRELMCAKALLGTFSVSSSFPFWDMSQIVWLRAWQGGFGEPTKGVNDRIYALEVGGCLSSAFCRGSTVCGESGGGIACFVRCPDARQVG